MTVKVVVVGDVGPRSGEFHVGDEAMAEALIDELAHRGVEVSAIVSAVPSDSSGRYSVPAIDRLAFDAERTPTRAEREARLSEVLGAAHSGRALGSADPANQVIAAVAESDGLIVAGGGNLMSLWPEHIYERNALVAIASTMGKPVIISGQSLGPALTARDGQLVAELLSRAALVGVRERESLAVARALGIEAPMLRLTPDDAIWLSGTTPDAGLPSSYCVVTFAAYTGLLPVEMFIQAVAGLLDRVVALTDLDIVFLPHLGSLGDSASSDELVHRSIAESMASRRTHLIGTLTPREVVSITQGAELSISTRYHPAVFASAAGVPTVAITLDAYTSVKICGALEHLGLAEFAIPSTMLASGQADAVVAAAWENRVQIREHVNGIEPTLRAASAEWWDDVVAVLEGARAPARGDRVAERRAFLPPGLSETAAEMTRWQRAETTGVTADRLARQEESPTASRASDAVLDLERQIGESQAVIADYAQRVRHAELALEAAHLLVAEVADPLFESRLGDARISAPSTEIEALLNTRTFRWTAGARRAYGRARLMGRRVLRPFRS